jgi:hypothetical protein
VSEQLASLQHCWLPEQTAPTARQAHVPPVQLPLQQSELPPQVAAVAPQTHAPLAPQLPLQQSALV